LKNLNKLEDKLIIRQNDCVKALTKKLADRDEITKKFRIANNSIKNIYELVKFTFIDGDEDLKALKVQISQEMENNLSLPEVMQMISRYYVHNSMAQGS
jgi:hypothetical protein